MELFQAIKVMFSKPPAEKTKSRATAAAEHALFLKREANKKIPDTTKTTRQQRRLDSRIKHKDFVSALKKQAMEDKKLGGSAAIIRRNIS